MGLQNLTCFRCEQPGHIAAECDEMKPAASRAEHEARIARYVTRWQDGGITEWQKRKWIAAENHMYYGGQCKPELRKT